MKSRKKIFFRFLSILIISFLSLIYILPPNVYFKISNKEIKFNLPAFDINIFSKRITNKQGLKKGLDIEGGMQIVLEADMKDVPKADRYNALLDVASIIKRRVDFFGINEPVVQTSVFDDHYRIIVELPGVVNKDEAVKFLGSTTKLEFRLQKQQPDLTQNSSISALLWLASFEPTDLTGKDLKRAYFQFDPQTGRPSIALVFTKQGKEKFAKITKENKGKVLGIFVDGYPLTTPVINDPILDGVASIVGDFSVEQAKKLAASLNAGALPVSIKIVSQKNIRASLGEESIKQSIFAGIIGIILVILYMIALYGFNGIIAAMALIVYAILTIAIYKFIGVTLSLPGIAGLLLSIGMAVDSNILIFERIKEELRKGEDFFIAQEQGFKLAWENIKDANILTILISLILINPFNFSFLNSSSLVRGFGITLLIGVIISMFTGVVVTRTFMRFFYSLVKKDSKI